MVSLIHTTANNVLLVKTLHIKSIQTTMCKLTHTHVSFMKNTPAAHPHWTDIPRANICAHAEAVSVADGGPSAFQGVYFTGQA
jgi:hypothetical protein